MNQWRHEVDVENQPEVVEVEENTHHNEKLTVEAHFERIICTYTFDFLTSIMSGSQLYIFSRDRVATMEVTIIY